MWTHVRAGPPHYAFISCTSGQRTSKNMVTLSMTPILLHNKHIQTRGDLCS